MALDSILHIFIGGIITIFLLSNKVSGVSVFFFLAFLAFGKEAYDHTFTMGHCYPKCMDEHATDFFFSLLFFFLYIPIFALTTKNKSALKHVHYIALWFFFFSGHLVLQETYQKLTYQKQAVTLKTIALACN